MDLVEKSGAWFSYKGQRIGQGRDNARLFLKANPEIRDELDSRIRARIDSPSVADEPVPEDGEREEDILGLDL